MQLVRYICGGRLSSFGRSLAVIEEISKTGKEVVDVVDEVENDLIEELAPPVDNEVVNISEDSDLTEGSEDDPMDVDASDDCLEMIDMNSNLVSFPEDEERCPTPTGSGECQHPSQNSTVRSGEDLMPTGEDSYGTPPYYNLYFFCRIKC